MMCTRLRYICMSAQLTPDLKGMWGAKHLSFAVYHISKLCGAGEALGGDSIHRDLDRLDRWDGTNSTKFKKAKQKYRLGGKWMESRP